LSRPSVSALAGDGAEITAMITAAIKANSDVVTGRFLRAT
jgi:hypothetical protein